MEVGFEFWGIISENPLFFFDKDGDEIANFIPFIWCGAIQKVFFF